MTVEVLYFEGCPNFEPTLQLVREVVDTLGLSLEVREVEVPGPEQASALRFIGPPSVRVDGRDIEPGADDRAELKCPPEVEAVYYEQRDGLGDDQYLSSLRGQYLLLLGDYPTGQKPDDLGVKNFLKLVARSRVKSMGCGSHFLPMEYPDLILREIRNFLGNDLSENE